MEVVTQWDRATAVQLLRPKLWRYLGPGAEFGSGSVDLERVDELSSADLRRLFATHLTLRESTTRALDVAECLLHELPSASRPARTELDGFVHGPVDWARTLNRRHATATSTSFVCALPERRYDTPLGRLIQLTLASVAELGAISDLPPTGSTGSAVAETTGRARRLLRNPKLSGVRQVRPDLLRHLDEIVRRRPECHVLVDIVGLIWRSNVLGDRDLMISTIEDYFLAPTEDFKLFELMVGFDLVAGLQAVGYMPVGPVTLMPQSSAPFATLEREDETCTIWWQRPAWILDPSARKDGAWWRVLDANHLGQSALRPDFVLDFRPNGPRLLVEVKLTASTDYSPTHSGLRDVFAYLHDAPALFAGQQSPHALVVAWNASSTPPAQAAEVWVTGQSGVAEAVIDLLGR